MATSSSADVASAGQFIPQAPILIPPGPWEEIPGGGVTSAKGFKAHGMYAGLRAKGNKPDLAVVVSEEESVVGATYTQNVMCAAPVLYCKDALSKTSTGRAVLINAGQANAATGDAGYAATVDCASSLATLLNVPVSQVLIQSTGVIGQPIKKDKLIEALPVLVGSASPSDESALAAAVAITTTDLVSKSAALRVKVGDHTVTVGGMCKGSGMIHPNMATMLGVVTTDAAVTPEVWAPMVRTAVQRSFNQITVDGDTSTNDCVIALASAKSGASLVSDPSSAEAATLQAAIDALFQGLAKSIAWDGEGATCLIEVSVSGADTESDAATIAKSVAASSLAKAAVYGRDPNWGRIACAAGYAGIDFDPNKLDIKLGEFHLMKDGQPLDFDRSGASAYLKERGDIHGTVNIDIGVGSGSGSCKAWGCDLSYDYVKINAEYTT